MNSSSEMLYRLKCLMVKAMKSSSVSGWHSRFKECQENSSWSCPANSTYRILLIAMISHVLKGNDNKTLKRKKLLSKEFDKKHFPSVSSVLDKKKKNFGKFHVVLYDKISSYFVYWRHCNQYGNIIISGGGLILPYNATIILASWIHSKTFFTAYNRQGYQYAFWGRERQR